MPRWTKTDMIKTIKEKKLARQECSPSLARKTKGENN